MKSSFYNVFFKHEDKMIGYNTITDNFIVLDTMLYELFEASVRENELNALKEIHPSFYELLKRKKFIVQNKLDELNLIKEISEKTDFDESTYQLTINTTMNCNFKCWYCYENHINDSKISIDTEARIKAFIENIINKKQKLNYFNLQWFGGEPLLFYNRSIKPLQKFIYNKFLKANILFNSGITTNGLLINKEMLIFFKKYGLTNFQITLDGHRKRHNEVRFISKSKGSYDQIIKNIFLCLEHEMLVKVRINVSEETLGDLNKIIEDFKILNMKDKLFLSFSFHKVWQVEKDLTFDISNIIEQFRLYNLDCDFIGENNVSISNSCYADKMNQATINFNGDVFKCTARDFKKESREGVLEKTGEIQWNNKYSKRMIETRFKNKPCLDCKILPICNGGCSQHRMENENNEYCIYNFDEDLKLQLIREKFKSRLINKVPSEHENESVNELLWINESYFNSSKDSLAVQQTLDALLNEQVREKYFEKMGEINNLYIKLLFELRKNNFDYFLKNEDKILKFFNTSPLNKHENRIFHIISLPVKAYYYFKTSKFKKAIDYTEEAIEYADHFVNDYSFLYGFKIQQIHNIIRILFKSSDIENACKLNDNVICHLINGNRFTYKISSWQERLNIRNDNVMLVMVYQIFSETIKTITDISNSSEEANRLFELAFKNFITKKNNAIKDFKPIYGFLSIKKTIVLNDTYLNEWRVNFLNSKYHYFSKSFFYSIFSQHGGNSYEKNKIEFKRIYE